MVANDNKYMTSAVEAVYLSNENKNMIKIAQEREDYLRTEAYHRRKLKELSEEVTELKKERAEQDKLIQELRDELRALKKT